MMKNKIAVIDVGSNSVRLMLVADGKVLYKRMQITRLADGLALAGGLQEEPMSRTSKQISVFADEAKREGAEKIYAYATAAVRSATNGAEFVKRVKKECALTLEVLSGEEEAEIGLVGALNGCDGGLLDIGGGSSELILQKAGKTVYRKSVDVGVVRLKDVCGKNKEKLTAYSKEKVNEYAEAKEKIDSLPLYAVGGTATSLAAIHLGLSVYDGNVVTGTRFSRAQLQDWADRLSASTIEEIAKMPCVGEKRAQVLTGGAVWLAAVLEYLAVDECIVSDSDNLEGYARTRNLL